MDGGREGRIEGQGKEEKEENKQINKGRGKEKVMDCILHENRRGNWEKVGDQ